MSTISGIDWFPLWLSLRVAALATLVVFTCGTAIAYMLARRTFKGKDLLDSLFTLPLVLPPTVLGYYLLVLLSRSSPLGRLYELAFGKPLVFTWQAAVVAAVVHSAPLFVKAARGRVVDHDALLRELQRGRIHAVLDVTDPTEPLPLASPFFALENCVELPHMAAVTVETRRRQSRISVDEILRYLSGEPLRYQLTRERWDVSA